MSKHELQILRKLLEIQQASIEELAAQLKIPSTTVASIVELLKSRNLVEVFEHEVLRVKVTDEALRYAKEGFPEERLVKVLDSKGGEASIDELKDLIPELTIAIAWAKKRGWIEMIDRKVIKRTYHPLDSLRNFILQLKESEIQPISITTSEYFKELLKRKLISIERKKIKYVHLRKDVIEKAKKLLELGEGISYLTQELIVTGRWKQVILKPYNVEALPPIVHPGKLHFFKEFVEIVREVMLHMGFEEIEDDYVLPEFWNFDSLFQAQDHPSRDIHDILFVEGYADLTPFRDVVLRAKQIHEHGGDTGSKGWRYSWSFEKASKLILRSHTTAVTIRYLSLHPEPPVRAFTIGRVFRRDNIDARHLPEFTNFDGIVMEKNFTFRKLLGILSQILQSLGFKKFMFKPDYFPFTEPSVGGYVYVEGIGWLEVFGAGMFRPEVLAIVNVKYPVGAWGMGLERLAMAMYGLDDIRLLYSKDVEYLRSFRAISRIKPIK